MKKVKTETKTENPRPAKTPVSMRFYPETLRLLQIAAERQGLTSTGYVEMALRNQFRKDGVQ